MRNCMSIVLPIRKKGEHNFFEINLPSDTRFIIDIEATIIGISHLRSPSFITNNVAGSIKLQSFGRSGLCFSQLLFIGKNPIEKLFPNYSQVNSELYSLLPNCYYENDYKPVPLAGKIESYLLYGCFEDLLGKQLNIDIQYEVHIILWLT